MDHDQSIRVRGHNLSIPIPGVSRHSKSTIPNDKSAWLCNKNSLSISLSLTHSLTPPSLCVFLFRDLFLSLFLLDSLSLSHFFSLSRFCIYLSLLRARARALSLSLSPSLSFSLCGSFTFLTIIIDIFIGNCECRNVLQVDCFEVLWMSASVAVLIRSCSTRKLSEPGAGDQVKSPDPMTLQKYLWSVLAGCTKREGEVEELLFGFTRLNIDNAYID